MHDGDDPEWLFVRRVCDQVIPHADEAQWTVCEIGSAVAAMRERNQTFESTVNPGYHAVRGGHVIVGDVIPNLIEIDFRFRVEIIYSGMR